MSRPRTVVLEWYTSARYVIYHDDYCFPCFCLWFLCFLIVPQDKSHKLPLVVLVFSCGTTRKIPQETTRRLLPLVVLVFSCGTTRQIPQETTRRLLPLVVLVFSCGTTRKIPQETTRDHYSPQETTRDH